MKLVVASIKLIGQALIIETDNPTSQPAQQWNR